MGFISMMNVMFLNISVYQNEHFDTQNFFTTLYVAIAIGN